VRLHVHLRRQNGIDEAVVARAASAARQLVELVEIDEGLLAGRLALQGYRAANFRAVEARAFLRVVRGLVGAGRWDRSAEVGFGSRGGTFWEPGSCAVGLTQLTSLFSSSPFLSSPYVILRAPFATTSHTDSRILSRWYRALGPGMGLASPGPMLLSLFLLALLC
jgi:hypothetical protein